MIFQSFQKLLYFIFQISICFFLITILQQSMQWREIEDILYHFYLIFAFKRRPQMNIKSASIFKEMESFIKTKDSQQCRSHHKKKCKGNKIQELLIKFYIHYYEERFLDIRHALIEFRNHLTKTNLTFLKELSLRRKTFITFQQVLLEFQSNLKTISGKINNVVFKKEQETQTLFTEENAAQTEQHKQKLFQANLFNSIEFKQFQQATQNQKINFFAMTYD